MSASRTAWAEQRLRSIIVSGELEPGARVRVEELAQRWDVSPTPLREAVRTLAGEGLIVLQPQRGARVAQASAAEMQDVYETRIVLEPMVMRLSLERADDTWRAALAGAWSALEHAYGGRPRTPLELEPAHGAFHETLLAASGSPSLLRICSQLATHSLRFRVLTGAGVGAERQAEHRELCEAALAGDESRALARVATHLARTAMSALGPDALGLLIERVRHAQGISRPVLEGLESLT